MRITTGWIIRLAFILFLPPTITCAQQWEELRFDYKMKPDPSSLQYDDFQGSILYGLYYEVDGKRTWITHYASSADPREEKQIDFSNIRRNGKLVLAFKDLEWASDTHNIASNFIAINSDQEVLLSEGFRRSDKKKGLIRNPDFKSEELSFAFAPAMISQQGDGIVYGRMKVRLGVYVKGISYSKQVFDFYYQLKFTPIEGTAPRRETLVGKSVPGQTVVKEKALPVPALTPDPVSAPVPLMPPAAIPAAAVDGDLSEGSSFFSISAIPANDEAGGVIISIRNGRARRIGEFMLYFRQKSNPGGRWLEVPYQNYRLQSLEDRQSEGDGVFRFIYQEFNPGEYEVLATRGEERDSAFFQINAGSQLPVANFIQDGYAVHLRVRGVQPPFFLQCRSQKSAEWSSDPLNGRLYREPLLTYFENLQDKVPTFQKNGTYEVRVLSGNGTPIGDPATLIIIRPSFFRRNLVWFALTLAAVAIFGYLRHLWWKSRTFYE